MEKPKRKRPSDSNQLAASVMAEVIKLSEKKPKKPNPKRRSGGS